MIVYDTKGKAHNKESVDARECVDQLGWTLEPKLKKKPGPKPGAKADAKEKTD